MKRKNSGSVRVWSVVGKAALLTLLAAAAIDGGLPAVASGPEPPTPPPDDPIDPTDWELHVPNTPYVDGPDEIPISELSSEEQAGIQAIGQRSRYADEVHQGWSAASSAIAADAAVQRAARQAGTTGLEGVGVEP